MRKKILIIIPAYNEEKNIVNTYNTVKNLKYNDNNYIIDALVVNDGSTDHTKQICEENNIKCINLLMNLGIGGAVQTGYLFAYQNNYDIAIQFDGDGQHDANYIEAIIQPILNGDADLVVGSRFVDGSKSEFKSSKSRRMGIKLISMVIKLITGVTIKDVTSGFRACNKNLIEYFSNTYPVEYPEPISIAEVLIKKMNVSEVPVEMHERTGGISSIHSWKNVYYMINILLSLLILKLKRWD